MRFFFKWYVPHFLELDEGVVGGEGEHVGQSKFMLLHLVLYLTQQYIRFKTPGYAIAN